MIPVNLGHPDLLRAIARQESCASVPSPPIISAAWISESLVSRPPMRYRNRPVTLARCTPTIETP